jgi:putative membrane protein
LFSWLAWRVMGYRVDAEAIYYRRGLLSKKLRKARLDRVQSIDLQQKLLPRVLGMAELVFDVAGGSDSNISLKYLSKKRAEELRDELLRTVSSRRRARDRSPPPRTASGGRVDRPLGWRSLSCRTSVAGLRARERSARDLRSPHLGRERRSTGASRPDASGGVDRSACTRTP